MRIVIEAISEAFNINNPKIPNRDIQKMSEYFNKGSNPKTLANTVKDRDKALSRYYISVSVGWKECEDSFYKRCIELGVSEGDLKTLRDKALKDKSIDIGDMVITYAKTQQEKIKSKTSPDRAKSVSNNKVDKVNVKEPKVGRKVIDVDTGFIITGDNSTPFG